MNNIEANAEINKLEAERYKIICDMNSLQQRIIFINQQLSAVRRTFKMEGWRLKKTPEKELTKEERERIIEERGSKCEQCGSVSDLTIHHVVPLSHGGTNRSNNLGVLCDKKDGTGCHNKYHRV